MDRNQYNLYINNVSDRTNEDVLKSHFSQYGKIESFTFLTKTSQRHSAAALITYGLSVDINYIIQHNQRINFDGNTLLLRRTLPINSPAYERFMSTNELLISLDKISNDEEFNEINIRNF
jgi:RNA recognition motif-containing protein